MMWQTVSLNNVMPSPWRNGGGATRELFAWPTSANWRWRASVAEVAASGAFSNFAGVQRWFAVLEGDGIFLNVANASHTLYPHSKPFAFDGAAQTSCELRGGTTLDFNLMLQGGATGAMQRICGEQSIAVVAPKIIAIYVHKTGASVQIDHQVHELPPFTFGWASVGGPAAVHVRASNALFMEIEL